MNATIQFPPKPEATVTLTMSEREAELLCHYLGRTSGNLAFERIHNDEGLTTTAYELHCVFTDMYLTLRKMKLE